MQPYFLPYIGYFQLMQAVDEFVVYDDVQFTRGWINRNRMLWNGEAETFTLPLLKGSSRANINARFLTDAWEEARAGLSGKFAHAYAKAPRYGDVLPLLDRMLSANHENLADFLFASLVQLRDHMGIETVLTRSSDLEGMRDLRAAERILAVAKARGATTYVNAPGGRELYDKDTFRERGMELKFIDPQQVTYSQFGGDFVPGLSILDVMMFNDRAEIRDMLTRYRLD